MPKKVREIVKMIDVDGWTLCRRTGTNHRKYRHDSKSGYVTISGNPGDDMAIGTYKNVLRQAGISEND
jgi:predicted RNA binding protein YcfA (HicA-like mRNA interferase family)